MPPTERNAAKTPTRAPALVERARAVFWESRYEEALALADEALALCELGRAREGLAIANAALSLDPASGLIYCVLGVCHHRLGDDDAAVPNFEKALALAPEDARIHYNFACYWAELGNAGECRRVLEAALKLSPERAAKARHDPSFARVSHEKWFRELIATYLSRTYKGGPP